ncbi:hypothetical protein NQ317_018893 [Molorchus minor]|uniref:Uncharacterized protein n=1 Tax=Molorchus minor TaxID=1323400 RepID=A0ABQ9IUG4_9CUCU|nr:hypothetical protein NQ317_018893 [Molorchus minor]
MPVSLHFLQKKVFNENELSSISDVEILEDTEDKALKSKRIQNIDNLEQIKSVTSPEEYANALKSEIPEILALDKYYVQQFQGDFSSIQITPEIQEVVGITEKFHQISQSKLSKELEESIEVIGSECFCENKETLTLNQLEQQTGVKHFKLYESTLSTHYSEDISENKTLSSDDINNSEKQGFLNNGKSNELLNDSSSKKSDSSDDINNSEKQAFLNNGKSNEVLNDSSSKKI